jgi:hypothetical protein
VLFGKGDRGALGGKSRQIVEAFEGTTWEEIHTNVVLLLNAVRKCRFGIIKMAQK